MSRVLYLRECAERLGVTIKRADQLLNEIVYESYETTGEEIEIVEENT
ncbi:restriction endonuclease [Halorubrum sp. SS5]|nr:restriction endonuclease [Halorubrum sp. SS5]